jgi:membrane carboxypeptidase/penicillin-binding protein
MIRQIKASSLDSFLCRSVARMTQQFDDVGQARRQPGFAFKPFVISVVICKSQSSVLIYPHGPVPVQLGRQRMPAPSR